MKRGFFNTLTIVLLAVFSTHFLNAGGGERGDEQDLKKKETAPAAREVKKAVEKEPEVIVEDVREDEIPSAREVPVALPVKTKRRVHNHGHLEFMFNYQLGPQMGCFTGNACQSFIPINRMCGGGMMIQGMAQGCAPQFRPVPVQTVYMSEMPSRFMAGGPMMNGLYTGMGMNAGMGGCGIGCSPTQPLMVINATPQPVWATANFMPRWNSFEATMRPVFPPQPQAVFNVPQQHTLGPRDIQQIYRP